MSDCSIGDMFDILPTICFNHAYVFQLYIYSIICSFCPSLYIGQRGRRLADWIVEHLRIIRLSNDTPVSRHSHSTGVRTLIAQRPSGLSPSSSSEINLILSLFCATWGQLPYSLYLTSPSSFHLTPASFLLPKPTSFLHWYHPCSWACIGSSKIPMSMKLPYNQYCSKLYSGRV